MHFTKLLAPVLPNYDGVVEVDGTSEDVYTGVHLYPQLRDTTKYTYEVIVYLFYCH